MLQEENFLLTERGCRYRADFEQTLLSIGLRAPTTLEFASIEAIKQCTMAGLGVAYLPHMTLNDALTTNRLVCLPWTPTQLSLQVIWHKDKWMSPAAHAFLETCQQVYNGYV
jgi:DNA-binding transcriptional LysR family regulator